MRPFQLTSRILLAVLCVFPAFLKAAPAEKPNIVFILADDLGYGDIGCFGQRKIRTPHLDQLAAEGTRLTQHYSGAPVCAPSRCVLMTGKHLGHAEIRGNRQANLSFPEFKEGQHPISAETPTLPGSLRAAGYETAAIGKWGLGPVGSSGDPNKKGFDLFFGYNCQAIAHSFYPASLWRNDQRISINPKAIPGHLRKPEGEVRMEDYIGQTYSPDLMVKEAVDFIDRQADRADRKPFFLYLAFIEPHVAMHPPVKDVEEYPADWDTQPYRGECGYLPHPRPRAAYAAMVSGLDRHVGKVMAALEEKGFGKNTLVIFTSDNGATHEGKPGSPFHIGGADPAFFNSNGGLKGYKGSVYEGGLRVPTLVRFPGRIPAGKSQAAPGYFADWFPTLCAAAGVPTPENLDGENLWPILSSDSPARTRRPMLWVYPEYGGQVALRIGDYKVLRRNLNRKKNPGPWEVYHLTEDREETKNLAATKPDLIRQAIEILRKESSPNTLFPLAIPDSL